MYEDIEEVDPHGMMFDETIEGIFGATNLSAHPDLSESFKEDGSLGALPIFREVDGVKKCYAGRKFVEWAQRAGLKTILAKRINASDDKVKLFAIKTNTNKHASELIRAKMVIHLFDQLSVGKGSRTDLRQAAEDDTTESQINARDDSNPDDSKKDVVKPKRNPTVYDKIGPILGISPKKAQMLKVIYEKMPAYFDRMERERVSVYEAYSKIKEEEEGYTPAAPREKMEVMTFDTTDAPKFLPGDPTYDVNAVYEFVENKDSTDTSDAGGSGKKKMVVKTHVIYTTQEFTCTHCGEANKIVVPKNATDEQ
jgi:hypothetical protein